MKMHGCGNDFVILGDAVDLGRERVRARPPRQVRTGNPNVVVFVDDFDGRLP